MLKKILCFIMLVFLCTSCTKNNEEITFSSWGSITETEILHTLISDFEKDNPDIKINFIHIPQNYFQKLHLLFASNTEPDIIFINNLYLPIYADKLEDLSSFNIDLYYPQSIEVMKVNGQLKAIPRDISDLVFYYNKDISGKISPNWSFEEFYNVIKRNTNKSHFGVSFESDIYKADPYIQTLGFDEGIKFYKNLEGKYAPSPSDVGSSTLAQMFLDKKIVFYLSGRWMYPKIKECADFEFGVIPFPGVTTSDASGWAISKNSKHKEKAFRFLKYISSKESIKYFADTGLIVPARNDVKFDFSEPFYNGIQKSIPNKTDKNYNKKRDKLNKELFN